MSECTCPEDGRSIPAARRVYLYEPGAETRQGRAVLRDPSRVHIFDKDCPVHGYQVIEEEE